MNQEIITRAGEVIASKTDFIGGAWRAIAFFL